MFHQKKFVHELYLFCFVDLECHALASWPNIVQPTLKCWVVHRILFVFPSIEKEGNLCSKKKRKLRKNEDAHMWALWRGQAINVFPPHRILLNPVTWPVVGTYGSWGFFVTTINPPGISWQCPFDDRKLLEANWTKSCVLIMKGVGWSLWTAMSHSITVGNKILKCLPRNESKFVRKTDW